jgi:molybdate/tungstate transport system substrate-binding protein
MVIAFKPESHKADQINSSNWSEILSNEEVRYGRSDPNSDPCGYRTVISLKLAEKIHKIPGMADSLLRKDQRYMRPKETDLIALLETRSIDYFFIYRSVATQHKLSYITLGDSINLKNPDLDAWYKTEWVAINGKKPGEKIKQYGEAMIYGLTIPKNTPNQQLAEEFAAFVLNKDKGQKILEENGQPSLIPSFTSQWDKIPPALQKFALSGD